MHTPPDYLHAKLNADDPTFFNFMNDEDLSPGRTWQCFWRKLSEASARDWLREIGVEVPRSSSGWKELAAIAGIPHKRILAEDFSRAEIIAALRATSNREHWLSRLRRNVGGDENRNEPSENLVHSPDYTSVNVAGVHYCFTSRQQAETIRALHSAWRQNTPEMTEKEIGRVIGSDADNFQLSKVFRVKKRGGYQMHPAWGTLVRRVARGVFRLAIE
jgi:hypothetical protein